MTDRDERLNSALDLRGGISKTGMPAEQHPLPGAATLVSEYDGTVIDANDAALALLGHVDHAALLGRKIAEFVVAEGAVSRLRGHPHEIAVRTMSWPHCEHPEWRVTVLVDVSDLVGPPREALPDVDSGSADFIEAQRIARVGSWVYYPDTGHVERSAVFDEFRAECGLEDTPDGALFAVHPDDQLKAGAFRRQLLSSEPGQLIDMEVRERTGKRVFLLTGRAEHDRSDRVARLQGTIQDITDQRRLERQLHDERRKLRDAQRLARLGTWEWDPATDTTRISDVLYELIQQRPGSFTDYRTFLASVHPEDKNRVFQRMRCLLDDDESVQIEHRYIRSDGAVRIFRLHGATIRDADGRALIVGTTQDVTEQRAATTRMERSSQRFTDLVSVTPVGIGLFDQSERLVDANDALCELLGYSLERLVGSRAQELTHPDEPGMGLRDAAGQTRGIGGRRRVPQRLLLRADGEPVYCELHVSLSVQDDGTRFWLVVFQDITERRRTAEALRYQATHDDLTGLPNRAAVKDLLGQLLSRTDSPRIAVLFCDIDNFKRVNDSLGHDAGDELLVALARRLEGGLPDGCTAGRLSGDEFVIICSDVDAVGGVDSLATKVSGLLRTAVPVHGQLIRVSASIGASVPNGELSGGADLLRFADAAMFEAKQRGAGKVSLASPALMASADRQLHLEGQLREALNTDALTLYYQPVVSADGRVTTAEALVRWPHPDRGLLSPGAFLPVAEQGDLLRDLDRWVLRTALREAARWPTSGGRPVAVAVNLAGLVPGGADFVDVVGETVADSGLDWSQVVLELVETALVDLPSRTRQAMGELVGRGIRFAVDDFGTGYSSLARLKDLPAQIIKVDRRFVSGVGGDASDFAVTRAVVDMARAMGRQCVAEGVETATQFHVLSGVGVDAYQGWLFSRPVPAGEFREMVAQGPLRTPQRN